MPTRSDSHSQGEWAARTDTPRRSVFGNYRPSETRPEDSGGIESKPLSTASEAGAERQLAVHSALARSFVHRYLAKAYEDPDREAWAWLCAPDTLASLRAAWNLVAPGEEVTVRFTPEGWDDFHSACLAAFGHAARGSCPLNEVEYGDIKADPLFQPHRLADLAAFYRAFGLEVSDQAGERHDHLCLELEFLCVLAAKEAYALEHQLDPAQIELCWDAQKKFLREHLGRWTPAFTRRLQAETREPALQGLASFTRRFIELECARFSVPPGSDELALRSVDETADRVCDSCGLTHLPPGALAGT